MRELLVGGVLLSGLLGAAAAPTSGADAADPVLRPVAACVSGAVLVPCADLDGDGLSDDDEVVFSSDPAVADTDGDGLDDGFEVFVAGASPADPTR